MKHSNSALSPLRSRLILAVCASLLASCGGGGGGDSGGGGGNGGGAPGTGPVTISGKARYEFPPPGVDCRGLNFNAVQVRPIRQATVEVLDATTDAVLDEDVTDDAGDFALTVEPNTNVYVRVRAELKRTGAPAWDVQVRDNTRSTNAALKQRPLYALDTAPFDSGNVNMMRDLTATTGWNSSTGSYTSTRAAAPFAVLDTAYAGMLLVLAEDPQVTFQPLDIFWSVNNRPADGLVDDGDIGTSFYSSQNNLFLLGAASSDADEFDDHVVAHEWGHYFEDIFSRSDSIGGAHSLGDALDMRVAFGEGFATALSGMVLDNPLYCDTTLSSGFSIDIESEGESVPGWFSEVSVMKIVYDLWDTEQDGKDTGSLGFGPIRSAMTGAQAATRAFTSIFSFATALKQDNPLHGQLINDLLTEQNIRADGINDFGDGETNDAGPTLLDNPEDVLPVYTTIVPDGTIKNICSNSQFDQGNSEFTGNKLSEHRFLRMTIDTPMSYRFEIRTTNTNLPPDDPDSDIDQSDPDIRFFLNGVLQNEGSQGLSPDANEEIFTTDLVAGDYAMALVEFRYQDAETPDGYPAQTCFDVSVAPAS